MAGFLADSQNLPSAGSVDTPKDTGLERQAILDITYADLAEGFKKKLPQQVLDVLRTLGIEPENMLMLAAGARGLGRLTGKGELIPASFGGAENQSGLSAVYAEAGYDPLHNLHNRLPMYAIRAISCLIDQWEVGGISLESKKLREAGLAMRIAIDELTQDPDITSEQRLVIYDLHLTQTLCDILARLCEVGNIANSDLFLQCFANMPVLNFLPAWENFMKARFGEDYSSVSSAASGSPEPSVAATPSPA